MTKQMSRAELIDRGFIPSAQRAKMIIPFKPVPCCTAEQYARLPADIKAKYSATADRDNLHHLVEG